MRESFKQLTSIGSKSRTYCIYRQMMKIKWKRQKTSKLKAAVTRNRQVKLSRNRKLTH